MESTTERKIMIPEEETITTTTTTTTTTTKNLSNQVKLYAPLAFNQIHPNIYRSAYPIWRNYSVLETLQLKTMICLSSSSNDIQEELRSYCTSKDIQLYELDVKLNQEPFVSMDMMEIRKVIQLLQDTKNHPILLFCLTGKVRTSCVVGCFRKHQQWAMVKIIEEFEQYADTEGGLCDLNFIERYRPIIQ